MPRPALRPLLAACLLALSARAAPARAPLYGGLGAVAVSPDGKTIVAGGQNRVVYVLASNTLAVQRRLWLGARVGALAFSGDGKRLLIEDDADALHLLDTATWKEVVTVPRCSGLVVAPGGGLALASDPTVLSGTRLRLLATADGSEKGTIELKERASAWAFAPDGKRVVVLLRGQAGEERRLPRDKVPLELTGLARKELLQKTDGLTSRLVTLDATGKVLSEARTWYTSDSDSTRLVATRDGALVLNFTNVCARIAATGAKLFETELVFNHAVGVSADGKVLVCGGLGEGWYGPLTDGPRVKFEVAPLPGQAEYFAAFAVTGEGAYGVTSGYRLVQVGKDGRVERVVAIY
jgi:hypothetical protein